MPLILTNYLRFLRAPTYQARSVSVRWREFLALILLYLLIGYGLNPWYERLVDYLALTHALEDVDTTTMVLGVVLIPPLEEFAFRLGLRITRVTLSVAAILTFFLGFALVPISQLAAALLIFFSIGVLVLALTGYEEVIKRLVVRWFGFFFYASTALFALVHILNFSPLNATTLLLSPVLVLPQFLVGTMLGYTRVRYGIGFSILFHMIVNATLFLLLDYFPT